MPVSQFAMVLTDQEIDHRNAIGTYLTDVAGHEKATHIDRVYYDIYNTDGFSITCIMLSCVMCCIIIIIMCPVAAEALQIQILFVIKSFVLDISIN